jgi:hypothetical protein
MRYMLRGCCGANDHEKLSSPLVYSPVGCAPRAVDVELAFPACL